MFGLDWLYCLRETGCSFGHYHSYLEVSFAINVLVGSVWRFIRGLILKSKKNSQRKLEQRRRWINPEALTEQLDRSLESINGARGASDLWVNTTARWGRGLCLALAGVIPLLLLLLREDEDVPFWAMSVFYLVPVLMVLLVSLIHYGWAFFLYVRTWWAFGQAKRALERKFELALRRGAARGGGEPVE